MLQALQNSDVLSGQYYRYGVTAALPGGARQCCCTQQFDPLSQLCKATICTGRHPCPKPSMLQACVFIPSS